MTKHVALILLFACAGCGKKPLPALKEGDLVFQITRSSQSAGIMLATHSKFSHVGLVLKKGGQLEVFEAVGPVKYTPIEEWISDGVGGHYAVRRMQDSTMLTGLRASSMERSADSLLGSPTTLSLIGPTRRSIVRKPFGRFSRGDQG